MKLLLFKSYRKLSSVGTLAKGLRAQGHEVHVLAPDVPCEADEMRALGISVHVIPFTGARLRSAREMWRNGRAVWAMARFFRREKFDVIHLNLASARFYGRIAALLAGQRVIVSSIRGMESRYESKTNWIDRRTVVVSSTVRAYAEQQGIPSRKLVTIYNGVDLADFDFATPPPALRESLGLGSDILLVGMVAYFRSHLSKGHRVFVDAAKLLCDRRSDVHFVMIGDDLVPSPGFNRAYFERLVGELGMGDRFHFLGERDDIPALMPSLDVHVLPSYSEGCPMAVLEAMAAETPNVASRIDSIAELIDHEDSGLLFDAGDPVGLANAVERVLSDGVLAKRMAAAARRKVESTYSATIMAGAYERLFRDLLPPEATC